MTADAGSESQAQYSLPSRAGWALPLAHMLCDDVNIQASRDSTTVTLRMNLAGRRHSTGPD